VDAGQREGAAFLQGAQGRRDQLSRRREDDGGVRGRRHAAGVFARPRRPHRPGHLPVRFAARAHVYGGAPVQGELQDDVRGGPEPVDGQCAALRQFGAGQRPVADDPGAQQRRRLGVRKGVGDPVGELFPDDRVLREAAVPVVSRVEGGFAQVLLPGGAERARPAGPGEPGDPHPGADGEACRAPAGGVDGPDGLVAGDDGKPAGGKVALDHVEVGPADPAGPDADPDLPGAGNRRGEVFQGQG